MKRINMQDNLKKYVEEDQDAFNVYAFDVEESWQAIAPQLEVKRGWSRWRIMGVAASITLLLAFTGVFLSNQQVSNGELAEVEQYYKQEIGQKVSLVKTKLGDSPLLEDLEQMDAAFAELKADLKDNVDNQEVIEALMDNYRLKLEILERILIELEHEQTTKSR